MITLAKNMRKALCTLASVGLVAATASARPGDPEDWTFDLRRMDSFFERMWKESDQLFRSSGALDPDFSSLRSFAEGGIGLDHRITDEGSRLRLEIDLPGSRKEDVQFQVDEDSVRVQVRQEQERTERSDGTKGSAIRQQRSSQLRSSSIPLPVRVEAARATSRFEAGKLVLELPKLPESGASRPETTVF